MQVWPQVSPRDGDACCRVPHWARLASKTDTPCRRRMPTDATTQRTRMTPPVSLYVSIATVPGRERDLAITVETLLHQSRLPDRCSSCSHAPSRGVQWARRMLYVAWSTRQRCHVMTTSSSCTVHVMTVLAPSSSAPNITCDGRRETLGAMGSSTRCRRAHHRHRAGSCLQTTIAPTSLGR